MASTKISKDTTSTTAPSLGRRLTAEVFGTFLLVFGVIGTAMFASFNTGFLGVSLAVGLTVVGGAYAVGHISGGHFNPAVSIGAAAAGRFSWGDVLPYIAAQIVGGILATTVIMGIRSGSSANTIVSFSDVSNGFGEHSPSGFSLVSVILAEIVLTAVFLYVILGVTDHRAPSGFAPLAIGLTLTLVHLVLIPISNASVNPARSIATAIYGGSEAVGQLWVFLLAPVVGALLAGITYTPLFGERK
ncbi:MAG: aquaporin Z [Rhodoglobus sp.]